MSVKLPLNQPVELALTRPDPKAYNTPGKPPCVMYSVVQLPDGPEDKLFLPPACAESLDSLQLRPREPFVVCRRKTPAGVEYIELHASAKSVTSRDLPQIAPTPTAASPKPAQSATELHPTRASAQMGAALIAAIDAATLAQQYASAKGIPLQFGPEDYRALAATLYIAATRDPLYAERNAA